MSRLIDADKLKTEMVKSRQFHAENCREDNLLARCETIVDEQPTVDAIEVVRCKDCVWNKQPQCPLSYTSPISEDGEVSVWYKNKGNDYCSYGKRKGGGLEDKPTLEDLKKGEVYV